MLRRRLRLWVVGLFVLSVLVAAVIGGLGAAWTAVLWYPPDGTLPTRMWVGLAAFLWIKAWTLWQVFSAFPQGRPPVDRQVVWLRRVLYLAAADLLVLWLLPEVPHTVLWALVWAPLYLLFVRVATWASPGYGTYGPILALGAAAAIAAESIGEVRGIIVILALCPLICQVLILRAQGQDGRWSGETVSIGWKAFVLSLGLPVLATVLDMDTHQAALLNECVVVQAAWLARSAAEVTDPVAPEPDPPVRHRVA